MESEDDFRRKVEEVAVRDGRYRTEAYFFVYAALEYTLSKLPIRRHVTGKELLEGISQYAKELYGPMVRTVFEHWGVTKTDDFGQIVFTLVDASLMGKTDEDSIEDFKDVYDFEQEFGRAKKT